MLTTGQAAKRLHVHPNTLRRWSDEGRIAASRTSARGDRFFSEADVEDYLREVYNNISTRGSFRYACAAC